MNRLAFLFSILVVVVRSDLALRDLFNESLMDVLRKGLFDVVEESEGQRVPASMACNSEGNWDMSGHEFDEWLQTILNRGTLRVGGVQGDWGPDGNYTTDVPTGFWPDYMRAIIAEMSKVAGAPLDIEWLYYESSNNVFIALEEGEVDMTDAYYLISGFSDDARTPRLLGYDAGCPGAATPVTMTLAAHSGLISFNQVYHHLDTDGGTVGILTEGNQHLVKPILPKSGVEYVVYMHASDLITGLKSGEVVAAFSTGRLLEEDDSYMVEILSPAMGLHGPLFRKVIKQASSAAIHILSFAVILFGIEIYM
eukprot:GHVO01029351.1.p1 GENE.GHVO01029351.1~~GHVO01029351.1.p1  ORF type:complete len:309 (-),score=43.92 GHVO01029351.1:152-1078(-)